MTPIDELEKIGGESLRALPATWQVVAGVFLKLLVKAFRHVEGKANG